MEGAAVHQGEVYVMLRSWVGLILTMVTGARTKLAVNIVKDLPKEEADFLMDMLENILNHDFVF